MNRQTETEKERTKEAKTADVSKLFIILGNVQTPDMQTDKKTEKQTEAKYGYTKGPKDRKKKRHSQT